MITIIPTLSEDKVVFGFLSSIRWRLLKVRFTDSAQQTRATAQLSQSATERMKLDIEMLLH